VGAGRATRRQPSSAGARPRCQPAEWVVLGGALHISTEHLAAVAASMRRRRVTTEDSLDRRPMDGEL